MKIFCLFIYENSEKTLTSFNNFKTETHSIYRKLIILLYGIMNQCPKIHFFCIKSEFFEGWLNHFLLFKDKNSLNSTWIAGLNVTWTWKSITWLFRNFLPIILNFIDFFFIITIFLHIFHFVSHNQFCTFKNYFYWLTILTILW